MVKRLCILIFLAAAAFAQPQGTPLLGDWMEPGGSIVRIERCGANLCMTLRALSPNAPATTDVHNPDPSLRTRALCDLQIGSGFRIDDAAHASQGQLYDPRSGNTYRGKMALEGGVLKLRGYIGISLLGRTETWRRVKTPAAPCRPGAPK